MAEGRAPGGEIGYRRVAAQLRQDILGGVVAPGAWLRMAAVATICGVSVQPVREALQLLDGEGLVEFIPNRGARVRGLDRNRIIHIFEIREALESFSARHFAETAGPADLLRVQAVQQVHDTAIAANDLSAVDAANYDFHHLINFQGGNDEVIELNGRYRDLGLTLVARYGREPGYLARVRREHHALIAAFRRRDGWRAAAIGAAHVRATCQGLLARLDASIGSRRT